MVAHLPAAIQDLLMHPEYRTLVGVDIEGYGRGDRTDILRVAFRRRLSTWCTDLLTRAGAKSSLYHQHSIGDGFLFSIDPHVPRSVLLPLLMSGLRHELADANHNEPPARRMRLRFAMHGGDVLRDPVPLEGSATVLTCRLLDAEILQASLRATRQPLAGIVSTVIYDNIIRQGYPGIHPRHWHRVMIRSKEGVQEAWIHVPGDPRAPRRAIATEGSGQHVAGAS